MPAQSFTWPGGIDDVDPASYTLPEIGDLNWANTINGFLAALGDGAQCTTFQRFGVSITSTNPYNVSDSECVIVFSTPGTMIQLPTGINKQVIWICSQVVTSGTNGFIRPAVGETILNGRYTNAAPLPSLRACESLGLIFWEGDWKIFQWSQPLNVP